MSKFILKNLLIATTIGLGCVTTSASLPSIAQNTDTKPSMPMNETKSSTVVDVGISNKSLTTLVTAIKAAGLVETLSGKGPFTVFAPTNEAFNALPKGTLEMLLKPENKAKLAKVLTYHVVSGKVMAKDVKSGNVKTVEGSPVTAKVDMGKVMINTASVSQADIPASNGVIHIIDKVLLPPNLLVNATKPSMPMNGTKSSTVVDVAISNKSLTTLVTAVKAAGLVETLSGKGPFTVFAPTNEAFKALPKGTLEMLLKPENKAKLVKVLTYHVVPGKVTAKDVKSGSVKTVEGSPVTAKVDAGKVTINTASVTQADIPASNGVIHVIDKVLLPPNL